MIQKYGYFALIALMSIVIVVMAVTMNNHFQEDVAVRSAAISACDEATRCATDSMVIVNFIKEDSKNSEEVIRKCDRIIEYTGRSRDSMQKAKDMLLGK